MVFSFAGEQIAQLGQKSVMQRPNSEPEPTSENA
jgi:hypothetical protein